MTGTAVRPRNVPIHCADLRPGRDPGGHGYTGLGRAAAQVLDLRLTLEELAQGRLDDTGGLGNAVRAAGDVSVRRVEQA
jgi:hypothetical protein